MAERRPGHFHLMERFPEARALWSLTTPAREFPHPFTLTMYQVGNGLVILQEWGESFHHSWDVYVQASSSGEIRQTLDAVAKAVGV